MVSKKIGDQTIRLSNPPSIVGAATIVGPKEGQGPLGKYFDRAVEDDTYGEETYELAEYHFLMETIKLLLRKVDLTPNEIDYFIAGDLLDQIICSSLSARDIQIPYYGIYGACSTFAEGMQIGSILTEGNFANRVLVSTSSHFSSAERQYRFPLELGNQRPLTSQWTVTGAGAVLISQKGKGPYITHITTGKVNDYGIKDPNNMGTAMAPAAVDTIIAHFKDTGFKPKDYDLIITGDLGNIGKEITIDLLRKEGFDVAANYTDCGVEIFDSQLQDTHAGGSGAACSASVFSGYLYQKLKEGYYNRILFVPTGALLSKTSSLQGQSIPCIAHGVTIENTPLLGRK